MVVVRKTPLVTALALVAVAALLMAACSSDPSRTGPPIAQGTVVEPVGSTLATPAIYTSRDGELHLRIKAEQVTSTINGVSYKNIYTYTTNLVDDVGTYTPGTTSAYIGPEWHVLPGDHLTIEYINALPDNEFRPVGAAEAEPMAQPINLHTHGLTVRPDGNGDNVLLSIPQGRSNRFSLDIPEDQHEGLYWYHPHIHGLSDDQVYEGLAGHIVVGRTDGNYHELDGLTMRPMMVRYNVAPPDATGNLVDASAVDTAGTALEPRGRMVYTVNGQVSPTIALAAGDPAAGTAPESQVWAFTNVTGSASYILGLDEVDAADADKVEVQGTPVDFTVVAVDGTSMPAPDVRTGEAARRGYLLGQGGRVAILVQGASDPSKVVRLVQIENRSGTGESSASNFPEHKLIGGYRDYTRTVLAVGRGTPDAGAHHVATPPVLTPNRPVSNHDLTTEPVANKRTFVFNDVAPPSEESPNEFPVDFALFPNSPLAQPQVGTVEEWTILNYSSLHHPFHVHTQYNQTMEVVAPVNADYRDGAGQYPSLQYVTDLNQPQVAPYLQDVVNLPAALVGTDGMPVVGADGVPTQPGKIVLRVKIDDYLGTYVEHCHRLPHEDRGMMSMIRSIPHDPIAAVARTAAGGSVVDVVRSSDWQAETSFVPFAGYADPLAVAVGDVDGDAIPDIAAATTTGAARVLIRSGASGYRDTIADRQPFEDATIVGSIALGDLNGDSHDDLVVAQGSGGSRVVVLDGVNGNRLSDFTAYDDGTGGVSVATGIVEAGGRESLITGAGPGGPPTVNVYNIDLFGDAEGVVPDFTATGSLVPKKVAAFAGADEGSTTGVVVTTGYPFARGGGFASIAVAPRSGPVQVRTFTVGPEGHMGHEVSATGTFKADDYEPAAARMAMPGPVLDLRGAGGFADGATIAFVSTKDSADLVAVAPDGSVVRRWTVDGKTSFLAAGELTFTGASVAGM